MTGAESDRRTEHIPDWWGQKVHLVMMGVAVLAIVVGFLNNQTSVAVPRPLEFAWVLLMPYVLLSVYFDGVTIWKKYRTVPREGGSE